MRNRGEDPGEPHKCHHKGSLRKETSCREQERKHKKQWKAEVLGSSSAEGPEQGAGAGEHEGRGQGTQTRGGSQNNRALSVMLSSIEGNVCMHFTKLQNTIVENAM